MPRYQRFEELPAWKESAQLLHAVLDLVELPQSALPAGTRSHLERGACALPGRIAVVFETYGARNQAILLEEARELALGLLAVAQAVAERPRCRTAAPQLEAVRKHAESCARQLGAWMAALGKNTPESRGSNPGSGRPETGKPAAEPAAPRDGTAGPTPPGRNHRTAGNRGGNG